MQYTGKYIQKYIGIPYLLIYSNKINIIAGCVGKLPGLCYKSYLIHCHQKTESFDAVCKSTAGIAFNRLQTLKK